MNMEMQITTKLIKTVHIFSFPFVSFSRKKNSTIEAASDKGKAKGKTVLCVT
jgi:hypothetical protein